MLRGNMRILALTCVGLFGLPSFAALADDTGTIVRTAKALMDSGRYVHCGLDMQPAETSGYYRCFDFGPYRVVEDYPRLSVFVTAGGDPFRIFAAERGRGEFLFQGPWVSDVAPRLAKFAADAVAGGKPSPSQDVRRLDAEARLGKVIEAERPKPPPEPDPLPAAFAAQAGPASPAPSRSAGGHDYPVPAGAGTPGAPVGDADLKAALEAVGFSGRR
ncbi:hypothetical protein [Methylobacterium fujisawaense]